MNKKILKKKRMGARAPSRGAARSGTRRPAPGLHAVAMARRTLGMPAWRLVAGIWVSCLRVYMLQKLLENLRRDVVAPFWR